MESKTVNALSLRIKALVCLCAISVAILFACSDGQLKDGTYEAYVSLEGGSGRASVESPCKVKVSDGKMTATVKWSSSHYDYMVVEGEKYYPVNEKGNSTFEIPIVGFDEPMSVVADTTAMSKPYEIEYELTFSLEEGKEKEESDSDDKKETKIQSAPEIAGLATPKEQEKIFATEFSVYEYEDGYRAIATEDGILFLNIEDKGQTQVFDAAKEAGCNVLYKRPENIYLAATAAMSLIVCQDALENISYSSVKAKDWHIKEAATAMKDGSIEYAGKYSAPDYEMLVAGGCDLAVESTMILHTPKVADKLKSLGIDVFIDRASFEQHPMGRLEWVKVYGTLCGNEDAANEFFEEENKKYEELTENVKQIEDEVKVCFFYVNSQGQVVTRYSGDYIPTMIEMGGGIYLPKDLTRDDDESKSGSVTMSLEDFYSSAKEADILIYNGTISSPIKSVDDLIEMDEIFSEFSAVKNNRVYTSGSSLYQATSDTVDIMEEFYNMISDNNEGQYFTKVD